jgi:NitT/TauT family transport system permease protein
MAQPVSHPRWRTSGLMLAPWACILALWYGVAYSGLVNPALLPKPHEVLAKFRELAHDRLPLDVWMSTQRVFLGVTLGIVLAVPVGFVLGWYRGVRTFVDPVINFFRALPPIALIPLVIVYFGIGETAKVAILFYASFFAGVIVMYEGIAQVNPIFVRVARTLGASDGEIFRKVILPLAVPHVLTALRVALGVAWATLVASELIAAQQGLGALIQNASNFFQLDIIYLGIICIGFIALAMDTVLRLIARRLVSWQERIA